MAAIDFSTWTDDALDDAITQASKERNSRQQVKLIVQAANNLITTAHNNGYTKDAVIGTLTNIINDVYGTA